MKPIGFQFLGALACLAMISGSAAAAAAQPNIVFILADDSGLGEYGCYGGTQIPTPNVDRLAAEGMRFTNAYSGNAVCAPTRCVIMTGQHPGHELRRANQSKSGLLSLADGTVTVARMLHDAGYATGGFGKWGLGNEGTTGAAEKQGFDIFYGYYDQVHAHSYFPDDLTRNGVREKLPGNKGGKGTDYSHDLIEAETLKFIETSAKRGKPFFCYAAWTLPHGKFEIPAQYAKFSDKPWPEPVKIHAAMIHRLDLGVGRVMAKLHELGLDRNTIVMYSSDNGAEGPGRQTFNATADLRGWKRSLYEGGIRMPFIARWPGKIAAKTTSDLLTGHVDLMATAAELAGTKPPKNDGISILPTLFGKPQPTPHEFLYWEIYESLPFQQAVRMGPWKGYRLATKAPLELYDLRADPTEKNNVAAQHPAEVKAIEAIMAREHVPSPHYDAPEKPVTKKGGGRKKGEK